MISWLPAQSDVIKLIVLPFVIFSAAVGSDFVQQVDYQTESLTPLNITPTFDNGYLVAYSGRGASVYSQDGSLALHDIQA